MKTLGTIAVLGLVIFVPEGLVPGSVRLWRWATRSRKPVRQKASAT